MSEIIIFVIGAVIFAITVYGSVMAGGLALRWVIVSAGQFSHWAHGAMRFH